MSSLQKDKVLDRRITYAEIKKCNSKSLKNNKTGGSDGLVGDLFKYGGKGMANLLKVLYEVVRTEENFPTSVLVGNTYCLGMQQMVLLSLRTPAPVCNNVAK